MNNFDLIIFDCDGVLVDSERITTIAFSKVLKEQCGLSIKFDDLLEIFMGQSSHNCLLIIEKMLGHKPPPGLEAQYQQAVTNALNNLVKAVKGIDKAINILNENSIPYCVASGGSYEKMRTTLGKTNLLQYFENKLFSTSDVKHGKPNPDIYLHAAKSMNCIDPSQCIVIEDSPLGISGAIKAGMIAFGFADLFKKQRLLDAGAHHVFTNMAYMLDEISSYENITNEIFNR